MQIRANGDQILKSGGQLSGAAGFKSGQVNLMKKSDNEQIKLLRNDYSVPREQSPNMEGKKSPVITKNKKVFMDNYELNNSPGLQQLQNINASNLRKSSQI